MSAEWGELKPDPAHRHVSAGPSARSTASSTDPDPDAGTWPEDVDAGAWPEDVDLTFYADSSMMLPGKGDRGERCGEWFPMEFCQSCGEPHFGRSQCEQRSCPECWSAWARRRAEKITRRLAAARYAADDGLDKRAIHVVVSPPEGEIRSLEEVSSGFRDSYQLATEKGVRGGVTIFHGYRVTESGKELFEDAKSDGKWDEDEDGRLWAFVRKSEVRAERGIGGGDWRDLTYWSPHYHILGLSAEFEADDPDEQDGWVARRIRTLERFSLTDESAYSDMVGASMYLLSHAAFETDSSRDCVRWFGDLATTKFSPEESVSEGALSVIDRLSAEAASVAEEPGEGGAGAPEDDECENCGSTSRSPIWEAGTALQDKRWCEEIGRDQQRRLTTAFEWAIGEVEPPPGLKRPRTREEAEESFDELLSRR